MIPQLKSVWEAYRHVHIPRVLVVESRETGGQFTTRFFDGIGCLSFWCTSPEEALQEIPRIGPSLIVVSSALRRGMLAEDFIPAAREFRPIIGHVPLVGPPSPPTSPPICVIGHAPSPALAELIQRDALEYLPKPLDMPAVERLLASLGLLPDPSLFDSAA